MVNFNKIGAGSPQYAGSQSGSPQTTTSMPPGFGMPTTYPSSFASMSPDSYYDSNHEVSWNNQYSYHNYLQHHVGMAAHNQIVAQPVAAPSISDWSGDEANNPATVINNQPSPTMTICGSEGSSPRAPSTPQSLAPNNSNNNNNNNISTANNNTSSAPSTSGNIVALQSADEEDSKAFNRQIHTRSPYEWMKRTSYQNQPNPGKTRTKDKYRVVYTDHQRLELEKEFHYSRYITIRRKAELAQALGLSERQVKIWFQNRRAKDRKLAKKANEGQIKDSKEMLHSSQGLTGLNGSFGLNYMSNIMPAYSSHPSHLSSAMHMSHHPASTVCAGPPFNALHAAAGLPQHQVHHQHGHSHQQHSMMQYPVVGV